MARPEVSRTLPRSTSVRQVRFDVHSWRVVHNSILKPARARDFRLAHRMTILLSLLRLPLFLAMLVTCALHRVRARLDAGMSTAEYAVGTVAAVAFAVALYKIVRSSAVSSALTSIIKSALHAI